MPKRKASAAESAAAAPPAPPPDTDDDGGDVASWGHRECVAWLSTLPDELGVNVKGFARACEGGQITGAQLLYASESTRELRDSLGLKSPSKRVWFERFLAEANEGGGVDDDDEDEEDEDDDVNVSSSDDGDDDDDGGSSGDDARGSAPPTAGPASKLTRAALDETARAALDALDAAPPGAAGGLFTDEWLRRVAPCFDATMGAENLGTFLYGLVRFLKPQSILEIGGGYTSVFMLQALADNDLEMEATKSKMDVDGVVSGLPPDWYGNKGLRVHEWFKLRRHYYGENPTLHCVDDMSHSHCTARSVMRVAKSLCLDKHLNVHVKNAWKGPVLEKIVFADLLWVDFGVGNRLSEFLEMYWKCLHNGSYIVIHSTVTNKVTREWLERVRKLNGGEGSVFPSFGKKGSSTEGQRVHHVSFWEPHKSYQNSFTVLQKRVEGLTPEPIYSEHA